MTQCDLLIRGSAVMTDFQTIREGMDIAIEGDRILEVRPHGEETYQAGTVIEGKDRLFLPGFIDSHMHTGQQLLKGLVLDAEPVIWTRVMLPFESALTPEKMRLSAGLAALEMIKCGTTGFVESGGYFMDEAAAVYGESGLRGRLSCSTMDEPGLPASIAMDGAEAVARADELYRNWHGKGNLKVYYSLRALNSCSDELIAMTAEHAAQRGAVLQAHMNEYQGEVDGMVARTGVRPYVYLERMGVLSERFLGAHSLLLSEEERELIKLRDSRLCHCPFSNCGKAVPETLELLEQGTVPGFGSDGAAHGGLSLWGEMRIFRSLMNVVYGVPRRNSRIMPAETLFRMMFEGGALALDEAGTCGQIKAGCLADLISVRLDEPRLMPTGNLLHTLFECGEPGDVQDVIAGGRVLMRNREVLCLDEERILAEARAYQKRAAGQ